MIKQVFKQMLDETRVQSEETARGFIIEVTEAEAMQLEDVILWCRTNCHRVDEGFYGLFYDYANDKEMFSVEIYLKREE